MTELLSQQAYIKLLKVETKKDLKTWRPSTIKKWDILTPPELSNLQVIHSPENEKSSKLEST